MKGCDPASWLVALKEKNWYCEPENSEEAMEIQKKVTEVAKDVWGKVVGYKVALTSESSQKLFGGGPITGPLFSSNVLGNGSSVNLDELSDPLLEPELFSCEGRTFVAFEVPDNRYGKRWSELNWLKLTADLAGSYKVIVGKEIKEIKGLARLIMPSGEVVEGRVDAEKVRRNAMLLKGLEGCKLLGTVLPPQSVKEKGTYVFVLGDSEVRVNFV